MSPRPIRHQAISASAGSGKTFQLAHRYIRLLAHDVEPDRIIALTFSRKAAGEIFDSVVKYLREAASCPEQACKTGERIGKPHFGQSDFLQLLRGLLISLHRLHISTLDSFTVGVVRTFPTELGVPPDLQIMDSDEVTAKDIRQQVIGRIFDQHRGDPAVQQEFVQAFKQATFGQEEKGLERSLETFIGGYRSYYQILSSRDAWGQETIIWPGGSPWLTEVNDVNVVAQDLEALLTRDALSDSILNRWRIFLSAVPTFAIGSPLTDNIKYLSERLFQGVDGLRQGNARIKIERTLCTLSEKECRLALALLIHIAKTELATALQKTRGIHRVLDQYERFYNDVVRQRGMLTFADVQYLLTPANATSGGALISRAAGQDARLYIDYRLDCKLDHWLLDEFQDTSDLQWEVLRNLADEILQDTSGQRSFFYVGDVKQAIYGWRGGNPRLFRRILDRYSGQIEESTLSTSFRSSQPIIDTVNRVFAKLPEGDLPTGAIKEWEKSWQDHQCDEDVVPKHGYVALLEPLCSNGEVKPTDEDKHRLVARLLMEIDPLNRGLSVAVLVRTNANGKNIVNFLRRECRGMAIVHEGKAAIKDNPVVSVLLSLIKFAAHPGDTFAWRHLEMSPLKEYFENKDLDRNSLPLLLLQDIQTSGFQELLRHWGVLLDEMNPLDVFGRKRLKDLINAAAEFDETQTRDCNTFLRFIDNYQVHELSAEDAVRVMTIHQSKGLGFDIVILPDLQGSSIIEARDMDFVTARDSETDHPLWALRMPHRIVAQNDPVLASQVQAGDETASFEALCVLYVAMTRAKQALYMITSFPGKTAKRVTSATLLKAQLSAEPRAVCGQPITIDGEEFTCLYHTGERDWYTKVPQKEPFPKPADEKELPKEFHKHSSHRRRLVRISPSTEAAHEQKAASLFDNAFQQSLDFGTAIHQLFETVSWIGEVDVEELVRKWREMSSAEEDLKQRAIEQFRQALTSPEVRHALSLPREGDVELWREKSFEVVLDAQWVTGTFDRVAIVRDQTAKPLGATILDFKSDAIEGDSELTEAAERYHPQLSLYGRALSQMLCLDSSKIKLLLVFTHPGRVHDLE
jgi:ATP-dependent helicase/nuclease subunit A